MTTFNQEKFMQFMKDMHFNKAEWDGKELTLFDKDNGSPWGSQEFVPGTMVRNRMEMFVQNLAGSEPCKFEV